MGVLLRCAIFLFLASGPALAGPRPESRWGLRWNATPGCIQAAPLARAVEARLGRTVFGPEPEFLVDGVLERGRASGWKAMLALVDARGNVLGSREVSTADEDCSVLKPRLLLVIALMIDPSAALAPAPPPEPRVSEPPPEPPAPLAGEETSPPPVVPTPLIEPTPPAESVPGEEEDPSERGGAEVTMAASGAMGLVLEGAPGLSAGFWFNPKSVGWLLRFAVYPYVPFSKEGGRIELRTGTAETGVCPVSVEAGRWFVSGCATAAFSLVLAHSEGFQQSRDETRARGDAGLRVRAELGLGRTVALHVGLGAGYGWLRPTVRLLKPDGTAQDLWLGAPVQASVDLGMSFLGP